MKRKVEIVDDNCKISNNIKNSVNEIKPLMQVKEEIKGENNVSRMF